jgi:hypothetical protein
MHLECNRIACSGKSERADAECKHDHGSQCHFNYSSASIALASRIRPGSIPVRARIKPDIDRAAGPHFTPTSRYAATQQSIVLMPRLTLELYGI